MIGRAMTRIHANQIKAARALLGWSQDELASSSGVSIATIRKVELGTVPRHSTMDALRKVIESAGVEFTDQEGVRRRAEGVEVLGSVSKLHDDILLELQNDAAPVYAMLKTCDVLEDVFGGYVSTLGSGLGMRVKALLTEPESLPALYGQLESRVIPKNHVCPSSYLIYGNKHALIMGGSGMDKRFVVLSSVPQTLSYKSHFESLWDIAFPISDVMAEVQRARS